MKTPFTQILAACICCCVTITISSEPPAPATPHHFDPDQTETHELTTKDNGEGDRVFKMFREMDYQRKELDKLFDVDAQATMLDTFRSGYLPESNEI